MSAFFSELVRAGLARVYGEGEGFTLTRPVELSGDYCDTAGWWHAVSWDAGRLHVSRTAYADRYACAERAVTERLGPWDEYTDAAFVAALRAELGLVAA